MEIRVFALTAANHCHNSYLLKEDEVSFGAKTDEFLLKTFVQLTHRPFKL